jgi:radical SAM superfamily enzyme YgiQ (UPF0313 family)
MYKDIEFERRDVQAVMGDIDMAAELCREITRRVFIGDSNSLVIKIGEFVQILSHIHARVPCIERVTSYARAKTILKRNLKELKEIREAGLTRLHVGLESGDGQTLAAIRKGATPEEMIEAGLKAKEAGFELSLYVLLGVAGRNWWKEHAEGTSAVLNAIDPDFIRIRTLIPQPGSPILTREQEGKFSLPPPSVVLAEERRIIAGLNVTSELISDHVSNYLSLDGKMPGDKNRLLTRLDNELLKLRGDASLADQHRRKSLLRHL